MRESGPLPLVSAFVCSTWMPALCVPLKGVTVFGQPALAASVGLSNHRPRWNMWTGAVAGFELASGNGGAVCGVGAAAAPGATMNVSMLNRPTNLAVPVPVEVVLRSPWYQDMPNGAPGCWITKTSKPTLCGNPLTLMV